MRPEAEFHYRIRWRSRSPRPGHHASSQAGGGMEFKGHDALLSNPDPRNLDIRASLLDPFERFVVRSYRQSSCIPVQVIADLSASFTAAMGKSKQHILVDFLRCTALSAFRTGDPFAFHAAADSVLWDLNIPLSWYRSLEPDLLDRIQRTETEGQGSQGLSEIAAYMGHEKSLVFLLSDFHITESATNQILDSLNRHDVVPVVVWSSAEYRRLPKNGLMRIRDPETGQEKTVLMRPALKRRWEAAFEERKKQLRHYFALRGSREPFFIEDQLDADQLTHYFCQE